MSDHGSSPPVPPSAIRKATIFYRKMKKHARATHDYSTPKKKRQQPHILENNKLIQKIMLAKKEIMKELLNLNL